MVNRGVVPTPVRADNADASGSNWFFVRRTDQEAEVVRRLIKVIAKLLIRLRIYRAFSAITCMPQPVDLSAILRGAGDNTVLWRDTGCGVFHCLSPCPISLRISQFRDAPRNA